MSLCIVAACQEHNSARVVFSHDWKVTEGDASSENTDKLAFVKRDWPAVFAGQVSDMELMGTVFWDHLSTVTLTPDNAEPELQIARGKFRSALIDRNLQGRFGMGYDTFMRIGKKSLRPQQHQQVFDQLQMELSDCTMLAAGIIKNDGYLYEVTEQFAVPVNHFGTIGEGCDLASRWLHWRGQNSGMSLRQTLLNVYEAQRFGSMVGTVGRVLSMYVLNSKGILRQIRPSLKRKLEAEYQLVACRRVTITTRAASFLCALYC